MPVKLSSREQKALDAMWMCPYEYEVKGKMGADVGLPTLGGLVERGLAETGDSPRHRGSTGWRITDAGRAALGLPARGNTGT